MPAIALRRLKRAVAIQPFDKLTALSKGEGLTRIASTFAKATADTVVVPQAGLLAMMD